MEAAIDLFVKTLIAEDDPVSRHLLEVLLGRWGYQPLAVVDGEQAWERLRQPDGPQLAILDWMMPKLDGVEVCRRVRALERAEPIYVILLTARERKEDLIAGFEAGADDYLIKPFDHDELKARLRVGVRVIQLQASLANRVKELEDALTQVKQLQGMLPICTWCKKIRNDQNYWQQVEEYLSDRTQARFTHGICPDCLHEELEKGRKARAIRQPPEKT